METQEPPDGHFERDLKWSVPANARVETPAGSQLVHDDRLISAALIAEVDRLYHPGGDYDREGAGERRGACRCDRSGAAKGGGRAGRRR